MPSGQYRAKVWLAADDEILLLMRRRKKIWREIGLHFGVTEVAARLRYAKLTDPTNNQPERRNIRWNEDENRALLSRVDGGEDIGEVAKSMSRTRWACVVQYNALKRGERPIAPPENTHGVKTSREKRDEALTRSLQNRREHLNLTSAFFGDPLPGRSALDRRGEPETSHHSRFDRRYADNRCRITLATEPLR